MGKVVRFVLFAALVVVILIVATVILQDFREARDDGHAPVRSAVAGEIVYQAFGDPDAPAVVIVPGTAAWSGFWVSVSRQIAKAGYHVIAVDLPPFGYSGRPVDRDYSRRAQSARLAKLIDMALLRKPVVLAHSFGAGAAAELAMRAPEKLGALVLVDGALALPPDGEAPPPDNPWLKAALTTPFIARVAVDAVLINPWLTRRLLAGLLARPEAATDAAVATLQQPYSRPGTSEAYARWLPSLAFPEREALSADPANYRKLNLPVALIWGADDAVTPLAQGQRLQKLIPGAKLEVLPGVGHIPHIEDEQAFIAAALKSLQQLTR